MVFLIRFHLRCKHKKRDV